MRLSPSTLLTLAVVVSALLMPSSGALAAEAQLFQFEQQAKLHCPDDVVVWVNLPTGIYNLPGDRWYGSTKHGSFVCRAEGEKPVTSPAAIPKKTGGQTRSNGWSGSAAADSRELYAGSS
jgi:hypothetical protein